MIKKTPLIFFTILLFWMVGCKKQNNAVPVVELPQPYIMVDKYTPTVTLTPTLAPTLTPTTSPLMTLAPTLSPTATPDPFLNFYISTLANRTYGGGVLQDIGGLYAQGKFSRRQFKYRSEGLDLYGFLNIPEGEGPFPIIIMLHGYVEPGFYRTVTYSARYADDLAENGFFVIHPNLRRYAPSEDGPNQLGIGDTIDTLNLIALVRRQAGMDGLLKKADASRIAMWGHSMGGGIVIRTLILDDQLRGGLLYASIHTDEKINLSHFEDDGRGVSKLSVPEQVLDKISPSNYLEEINVPISIHHGVEDSVVPVAWSEELCNTLSELRIYVECNIYPRQLHTFLNDGDLQFMQNSMLFFRRILD